MRLRLRRYAVPRCRFHLTVDVVARVATRLLEVDLPFATFIFDDVPFAPGFPVLFGDFEGEDVMSCGG